MHVFLTGPVQIGKSTLIAAALEQLRPERLGGFRTVSAKPEADGSRPVYLHPAAAQDQLCEVYNRVGIRRPALGIASFPDAFETAGLAALEGWTRSAAWSGTPRAIPRASGRFWTEPSPSSAWYRKKPTPRSPGTSGAIRMCACLRYRRKTAIRCSRSSCTPCAPDRDTGKSKKPPEWAVFCCYISCRPSSARRSVTSSAYSSWLPTGMP